MNDTRIEQMLEENYKEIYGKVEPSDYLKCALYNSGSKHRIGKLRLRYAAVFAILVLVLGGGSVYAYMNPALVRDFFGESMKEEVSNQLYNPVDQSVQCNGYVFTLEGYIYTPEIGVGYVAIRVNREDGSVPEIANGSGYTYSYKSKGNGDQILSSDQCYAIDQETFHVFLKPSGVQLVVTHIAKNEEGAYIYFRFENVGSRTDSLPFYVATEEELADICENKVTDTEKENCSSMQELVIPYLKGAEIDISEVNQNVVAFSSDAYEIKLSYLNLLVTTRDYDIDSLVIIEEDGNRIDVIKDGNIQKVENQWCGPFQSLDEDGTQVLDYTLGTAVDPEHVQVELDGHVLK